LEEAWLVPNQSGTPTDLDRNRIVVDVKVGTWPTALTAALPLPPGERLEGGDQKDEPLYFNQIASYHYPIGVQ